MTKRVLGQIRGLPESRGFLMATNGVMCVIERETLFPYQGHVEWFVPDDEDVDMQEVVHEFQRLYREKQTEKAKLLLGLLDEL